ncbi:MULTISPECIES: hypothetical protein [Halobacteriales]|uniref:Uncharacterized protein n=2 Tax=Halobacteriales TaxID=2235 RepID=A0A1I0QYI6_9EURY|nr:hypothetical protein [Natrinema salifodinae]SEW32939.1 hypothetical protein SAMN05216285_4174 [Natrinema salifodinae]
MDAGFIFPAVATVLLTLLVVYRHGEAVESAYNTFDFLRRVVGAILIVLIAFTFLRSGSTMLFLIALGLIAFATIWFAVERPDKALV